MGIQCDGWVNQPELHPVLKRNMGIQCDGWIKQPDSRPILKWNTGIQCDVCVDKLSTWNEGLTFKHDLTTGLGIFVYANFSGNWYKSEANQDRDTERSRHVYIIWYMGCPIIWKSHLQTKISLSSTKYEYTRLSFTLQNSYPSWRY